MRRGAVLDAVKRDTSKGVQGSLLLLALCALVLGWNWRYVYNWIAGPFPLEPAMLASDDAHEWVQMNTEGLMHTPVVEERTLRLLGLDVSTDVSAQYLKVDIDGQGLIVKVDDEFSGDVVDGRLEALPDELREQLQQGSFLGTLHPRLLDGTTSYRWDFNLFVLVAGLVTPFAVLTVLAALWQSGSVYRHAAISPLRAAGEPQAVIERIEDEIVALGDDARAGPLWVSSNWVVLLFPELKIFAVDDLGGIGVTSSSDKHGVQYELTFWPRDNFLSVSVGTTAIQAAESIEGLTRHHPWLLVNDPEDFENRWRKDRKGTLADVDARRNER